MPVKLSELIDQKNGFVHTTMEYASFEFIEGLYLLIKPLLEKRRKDGIIEGGTYLLKELNESED